MTDNKMKAVISVIGKDMVGILAKVSAVCAGRNANISDVSQSVLEGYFCMIMVIDIDDMTCEIEEIQKEIQEAVPEMVVHVMHENIFNSMHRI